MPAGERTATHPVVKEKVQEMLDKDDRDFRGVLSTAKTALTLYSDPLVARNTSASDFTIADLVNYERPIRCAWWCPLRTRSGSGRSSG
jgi:type IV secretion system protein VirD4